MADDSSVEQVVIVRWPEESARLARLRTERVSRLLLIPPDSAVPSGGAARRMGSGCRRTTATCALGWPRWRPGPPGTTPRVPRHALMAAWPDERVTGHALRNAMLRLRRRVAALGLEVRAVPGHGHRLQRANG